MEGFYCDIGWDAIELLFFHAVELHLECWGLVWDVFYPFGV